MWNNLIKIKGIDKFNFIQGITSNDINIFLKKHQFSHRCSHLGKIFI